MLRLSGALRRISRKWSTKEYSTTGNNVTNDLRTLLRETAQPVAVITSFMPSPDVSPDRIPTFHGATLSSFTSIAMDPHPLVAFSLRIPSRMGTSLKSAQLQLPSHMVINVLSAAQESTAVVFSRPDLHPQPFSSVSYWLSNEGLPILQGSLGALSCKLVSSSWPLHDLESLENRAGSISKEVEAEAENGAASELFIAQVTRVEKMKQGNSGDHDHLRTLPLLYHRKLYATTSPIPPSNLSLNRS